ASSISFIPQIIGALLLILIVAVNPEGLASMSRFVRSRASAHGATSNADGTADTAESDIDVADAIGAGALVDDEADFAPLAGVD
ncbi:MAG: hypothetical protein QOG30_2706, partial [Acidimicrobiaceae bacterium]